MNQKFLFLKLSGLLLLAFGLYITAPWLRSKMTPPAAAVSMPAPTNASPVSPASQTKLEKPLAAAHPEKVSAPRQAPPAENPSQSTEPAAQSEADFAPDANPPPATDFEQLWKKSDGVRIVTFPILAGQELSVTNPEFNFIKIEADFPVMVKIGNCQSSQTVQLSCNNVSTNDPILVQDLRIGYPADSSQRNQIKITAIFNR